MENRFRRATKRLKNKEGRKFRDTVRQIERAKLAPLRGHFPDAFDLSFRSLYVTLEDMDVALVDARVESIGFGGSENPESSDVEAAMKELSKARSEMNRQLRALLKKTS